MEAHAHNAAVNMELPLCEVEHVKVRILRSSRWFLTVLEWFIFGHPAYSPDLAPSDFWLFPRLKDYLGGNQFTSDEEVKQVTAEFYGGCSLSFYHEEISCLVTCYEKCLLNSGTHIEK